MIDGERFTPADELPSDLYARTRGLVDAAEIITKYSVFWMGGRSRDGRRVFVDDDVPKTIEGVNVHRTIAFHELGEWIRMNEGENYDSDSKPPGTAHYDANGVEKIEVERQGGNWEQYCIALRPLVKQTDEDKALDHPPPVEDWDLRPLEDDDPDLYEEMVNKSSTFSAPASATSGLQGYDLEGAVRRRKAKRTNRKANQMDTLSLFIPITKYDAKKRLAYGTIAAEVPDKVNEILDYESAVPQFKLWSDEISKASDGKSVGNVRIMHQAVVGGKMTEIDYDDVGKKITGIAKVLSDEAHRLIEEGALTGFSIGGGYAKRWKDPDDDRLMRYTPRIAEVSFVDNPCIPGATFEYVKMDGSVEQRTFKAISAPSPVLPPNVHNTSPETAYADSDSTQARGAQVRTHEGVQGFNAEKDNEDTVLADATDAKPGTRKPSKKELKDETAANIRHPSPKPDSAKEQSAVESTVSHHKGAPTASDVATRAVELAKAAGKGEADWTSFITQANADLANAAKPGKDEKSLSDKAGEEADREKKKEGVKASAGKGDDPVVETQKGAGDPDETQVWVHPKLPGKTFTRKADLRAALVQAEADEVAAKAAAPAKDLLDQIAKVLDPEGAEKVAGADDLQKPWAKNADLPKSVQGLPEEAKTVFREAANGQLKRDKSDEEAAMKVGWTAVKNGWEKRGEKWVKKDVADDEQPYWLVKREYSSEAREKYAKEGVAMRDGSYPIPDKAALKDAVQAFGRSKNKGAAKRHIVRRAKALGATEHLPADWHASTAKKADLEKTASFGTMQGLMGLLAYAEQFEELIEREPDAYEMMFSSGSTSIKVAKDICDRFGKLLGELGDIAADILDDLLNAMKDEERAEASGAAGKVAGVILALNKIGARNSKEDVATIKSAHDLMVRLEPTVCGTEKAAANEELTKMTSTLAAEREANEKKMNEMAETLKIVLASVQKIEKTPIGVTPPLGPNGERRYNVLDKAHDMGTLPMAGDGGGASTDVEKLLQNPDVLKVLADSALRAAQRSPMREVPGLSYGHEKK